MKEYLHALLQNNFNPLEKRNITREYLQARILESLQRAGAMIPLAFHGGTALRFLYRIPRFSEDLDFALERPSTSYNFRGYLKEIQSTFSAEGYNLQIMVKDQKIVHSAFVRAGKLHAILQRNYAKGRDLYDLMWYLSDPDWPEPNLVQLSNALLQTGWQGTIPTASNWREIIYNRISTLDWKALVNDVQPFLERPDELDLLTLSNFAQLLRQRE